MSRWFMAITLRLTFTIDRIENSWVIVEWANMAITSIWKGHLPFKPKEGDRGVINLWICRNDRNLAIANDPLIIEENKQLTVVPYPIFEDSKAQICFAFEREPDQ